MLVAIRLLRDAGVIGLDDRRTDAALQAIHFPRTFCRWF
jgi:hypothetical protein